MSNSKQSKATALFETLHNEMELTAPVKNSSGQNVKRPPRHLLPALTKKRKSLEKRDRSQMAVEGDGGKRLRGTKVAFDDEVLNSMPLLGYRNDNDDENDDEDEVDAQDILEDVNELGIDINAEFDEDDDPDYEDDGDDDSAEEEGNEIQRESTRSTASMPSTGAAAEETKSKRTKRRPTRKKHTIYRLRDFSSHRLSLRHGEALGAHVRGDSETAVQKLREVARAAPGAPQVYSSLGMVYESMLEELEKKMQEGGDEDGDDVVASRRKRRLELAHKTYASLHVAAVLCKRDFTLWERSGDTAMRIVEMYNKMMDNYSKGNSSEYANWDKERNEWVEHALSAYSAADNLRPPGVDVPCKLARVHIEKGNFMDALTILSSLRNRGSSDMEGSYPCWILYADLMMKIGFECKRWNEGSTTRQSYMAKRWLRKHSSTFDWKERRLQALCLALEAAAGSKSCPELSKRMKKRTKQLFVNEAEKDIGRDSNNNTDSITADTTNKDSDDKEQNLLHGNDQQKDISTPSASLTITYEEERSNLAKRNEFELQKFDWKSNSMNLVEGSHVHRDRMTARAALIEKQRESVRELAKRMLNSNGPTIESLDTSDEDIGALNLPLQASCATVCQIATLLLTQCVQSGLYEDGLVVARSVLFYYDERVNRHKRRKEKQKVHGIRSQSTTQGLSLPSFGYDDLNLDSDESDSDDRDSFISDDEDLEVSEYLDALKNGILPMDVRALYSLCLVGVGGQDFLAMNYLKKVILSKELNLLETEASVGVADDWTHFQTQFNLSMNKTALLALVTDITKNKPNCIRRQLQQLLKLHLDALDAKHGLDQIVSSNNPTLRDNALKILLCNAKMLMENAELDLESLNQSNKSDLIQLRNVVGDGISVLNTIIRFAHVLWRPNRGLDWSLPIKSLETLEVSSRAISLLSHIMTTAKAENFTDIMKVTLSKSQSIVTLICDSGSYDNEEAEGQVSESWKSFPLPCDWQSSFQKDLSLLAYNLCVGCCVSSFSGWTSQEFNLDQLHTRDDDSNMFGLNMEGAHVAGFLSNDVISSLSRQWEHVHRILPSLDLRYEAAFKLRKDQEWYKKIMSLVKRQNSKIAIYKENEGLMTLLSFSTICLIAAENSDRGEKDRFLKLAMSILLPMTQFSIEKDVWKSKIGARAISEVNETSIGYFVDENKRWLGPTIDARKVNPPSTSRPSRDQFSRKLSFSHRPVARRSNRSGFFGIHVPTSILLKEWNTDEIEHVPKKDASTEAKLAMKNVDNAMKNLRKSRTINALERSSLDVAVALVSVSSHNECQNPFLCLQQAAVFAAMGPKLGNSDEPLKSFLPLPRKCTALDALVILGRADCLRAIHFVESAQFLCSWVAKVCIVHRSQMDDSLPWDSRWRVIGTYLSFISANVNGTAKDYSLRLDDWEAEVQQEIEYAKSDAKLLLSWHQSNDKNGDCSAAAAAAENDMSIIEDSNAHQIFTPESFKSDTCRKSPDDALASDDFDGEGDELLFEGMNWASI